MRKEMFTRPVRALLLLLVGVALLFLPVGCGGSQTGSASSGNGRLALTVRWPQQVQAPSRLIPLFTAKIVVTLKRGETVLGTRTLERGESAPNETTVTFDNLAPGDVVLSAVALPGDSTAAPLASGAVPATIIGGQTARVRLVLASTIDHLEITPQNPSVVVGARVRLMATPKDAAGNDVLAPGANFVWLSSQTAIAAPFPEGGQAIEAEGVAAGSAQFRVTETDSGKTATTTVTVTAPPAPLGNTAPNAIAKDPTGKFLYVADRGTKTVSQFRVNTNGTLTPLTPATVSVALPPYSIFANPAPGSHSLYVGATDNTNGALYQFNINSDGTLTPLSPATAPLTPHQIGAQPIAMASDPAGKFLYVADHNNGVQPFTINPNGTLRQNGPEFLAFGQIFEITVSPDGKYVFLGGLPLQSFTINPDGTLTSLGLVAAPGSPDGIAVHPGGKYLYIAFNTLGTSGIRTYTINPDGTFVQSASDVPFSDFAYKVAVSPDGNTLYAVGLNNPDNVIAQFHINAADGTLTPLSPATVPAGSYTTNLLVSSDGKFVYVTNARDNTISQFRVNSDGTLTPLSPPSVPG